MKLLVCLLSRNILIYPTEKCLSECEFDGYSLNKITAGDTTLFSTVSSDGFFWSQKN